MLEMKGNKAPMSNPQFVLVHGAWHGAWCWDEIVSRLERRGYRALAPDLSGLGSRAAGTDLDSIGLLTHVADVVEVLRNAESPVVLVGHSYAGMVATSAAGQVPEKVAKLVIVDGFVPEAGEKAVELLPEHVAAHYREFAEASGYVDMAPRPVKNLGVTDQAVIDAVESRLTPHPAMTYFEAAETGASEVEAPAEYIVCSGWSSPFVAGKGRAEKLGWTVRDIEADHEVMLTNPELLTDYLVEAAKSVAP